MLVLLLAFGRRNVYSVHTRIATHMDSVHMLADR